MDVGETLRHWAHVRSGLYAALDSLTDEQLPFVPRRGLWSLGMTVCHIADTEDSWFQCAMAPRADVWPKARYMPEAYGTVAALKALLSEVHARTEAFLSGLDEAGMGRTIRLPWGAEVSLSWITWHILEHETHHRGEVYLMLGLMGMEAPDV